MTVNVQLAQAKINADVTGTEKVQALAQATGNVTSAQRALIDTQDKLTRAQARFMDGVDRTYIRLTKTRSEQLAMQADTLGLTKQFESMRAALVKAGIDGEHSFKHMIQSGGVFRELIVLIHESLIMGNYSRFGGSLMVLAERAGISAAMFTGLGAAITGAVVANAAFDAGIITGEMESTKLARALSLTSNAAGITEAQFNSMAESIGQQVPGSVLKARTALQALVSTGQFTGDTLASVARAAVEYSKFSGENVQKSVEFFAQMKDGAAKFAAKANEQLHFLTQSQYDYIAALERQGQVEAAEKAVADDFFTHVAQTGTENLGLLEQAVNSVRDTISGLWDDLQGLGRATTPTDLLTGLVKKQARFQSEAAQGGGFGVNFGDTPQHLRDKANALQPQIDALRALIGADQAHAALQAHQDIANQQGIQAHIDLKNFLPPADKVKEKIAQLKSDIAKDLGTNPNDQTALYLQSHMSAAIDRIKKEYGHQAAKSSGNLPAADTSRLQTQLSIMEQYARATNQSETAVLRLELAQGKLKGFTADQIKQLQDLATQHDRVAAAQAATTLQARFGIQRNKLANDNASLGQQLQELLTTGSVSKPSEFAQVQLAIAQGGLKGISQQEIAAILAQATTHDQLAGQIDQVKRSSTFGTQNAFSSYIDQATNAGAQVQKVWSDTFNGMQNMLVTALEGGKVSFGDFTRSIIADLLQLEVKENIMAPLVRMLGGVGGGTNGSGLPGILGGAGGSIIGGLMSGFGSGKGMSTASLIAHQGGHLSMLQSLGSWVSSFFANGGIMTSRGSLPLNMYANGGVANTPQMAVFGEGRGPEAYVPLPDGRSIPVTMRGAGGAGVMNHVTNHITIHSGGGSQVSPQDASRLSQGITYAIQQELIKQARDGGILSSTGGVFSGSAFK